MNQITATVISDASFYQGPNKNRGHQVYAGWAAWVKVDGIKEPIKGYGPVKIKDLRNSAEAEVCAALNGIWLAARAGASTILVRSDCLTVIHLINGQVKADYLKKLWNEAFERPDMRGLHLIGKHVKGHGTIKDSATWVNDWCDRNARMAMRASRKGQVCQSI
jgi:ribonuclease HI